MNDDEAQIALFEHISSAAPARHEFIATSVHVIGREEERFPDDFPEPRLRGNIKTPAGVDLAFDQAVPIGDRMLLLSQHIARGLDPDLVIAVAKQMLEEAERVKLTRKEQPLKTDLVTARGAADVEQAAQRLDPDQIVRAPHGR